MNFLLWSCLIDVFFQDNFGENFKGYDCPYRSVGCDIKISSLPMQLLNHLKHDLMQHNQVCELI